MISWSPSAEMWCPPHGKGQKVAWFNLPSSNSCVVSVGFERVTEGKRGGRQATEAASAPLRSQDPCA